MKKKTGVRKAVSRKSVGKRSLAGDAELAVKNIELASLRKLVAWFRRQKRILPWREDPSLYRVWVSEIMLQQTQVITVVPFFERFMRIFPTVYSLAAASEEAVLKAWEGLGYYSRARNLQRGAKAIVAEAEVESMAASDGFPRTREGWLEIPGVGPYTAGAITSIALGLPEPIVDGNVERVFARLRRLGRKTSESNYKASLWALSKESVESAARAKLSPSDLNQAWMELGATICTPKKPACLLCPISADCAALAAGEVDQFPEKKKRAEWILLSENRVAVVNLDRQEVLLSKASAGQWRAGLWDFPESVPTEQKAKASPIGRLESRHVVTRHKISRTLEVFSSRVTKLGDEAYRWISLHAPEVPVGSACAKGLGALRELLS